MAQLERLTKLLDEMGIRYERSFGTLQDGHGTVHREQIRVRIFDGGYFGGAYFDFDRNGNYLDGGVG